MSISSQDDPKHRQPTCTRSDTPTQRVETMSGGRDDHDTPPADTSQSASDPQRGGVNLRRPSPPPSRFASTSQFTFRAGEASQSCAQAQLSGIGQFARIAPEGKQASVHNSQRMSSRSSDSSSATQDPRIQEKGRTSAMQQFGETFSAGDRRPADTPRAAAFPAAPLADTDNEGVARLSELRAAPWAPSPMLPGLPRHSTENRSYQLIIRQQPQQGRLCGLGSKDKRPLDPLPILQLRVIKPDGTEDEDAENSPNLVLQVTLRKEDPVSGTHAEAVLVESNDPMYPWTRMLEGRLVASANVARDLDGSRACFFVFTDLSIRQEGQFRLAFKLLALGPPSLAPPTSAAGGGHVLAEALTEPFTIYSPRRFPGMSESTELAKCLARQGIQVPVRNDIRRRQEVVDSLNASTDDRDGLD